MKKTFILGVVSLFFLLTAAFYPSQAEAEENIEELFSQRERMERIYNTATHLYNLAGKSGRRDIQQALTILVEKSSGIYLSLQGKIGDYVEKNVKESPTDAYLDFKEDFDMIETYEDLKRSILSHGSQSTIKEFEDTKDEIYENFETFLLLAKGGPKKETIKSVEEEINGGEAMLEVRTENPPYLGEIKMVFEKEGWKLVQESWLVLHDTNITSKMMQIRSLAESIYTFGLKYNEFREAYNKTGQEKDSLYYLIDEISNMSGKDVNIYFSENDNSYCMYTHLIESDEELFCIDSSGKTVTGSKGEVRCSSSNISCE